MKTNHIFSVSITAILLLLPSCGFDVNLAPHPLDIAICRPIEITMSKETQEEIAKAVATAISSQIPEIKKQLFTASVAAQAPRALPEKKPDTAQAKNIIIVDVGEKSSNIPNSYHVPPAQLGSFDGYAALLDKATPILIYSPEHNPKLTKTILDKLKSLGFTQVGTYSGTPGALPPVS